MKSNDLTSLVRHLADLPAPRQIPAADLLAPIVTCRCKRRRRSDRMSVMRTPLIPHAFTDICSECPGRAAFEREDREKVRLVCVGCKSLVMVVPPHVNKATGGRLVAGGIYHLLGCPNCPQDVRERVQDIINPDRDPNKIVEFESKIFEVFRLQDPTTALSCLTKILSPSL